MIKCIDNVESELTETQQKYFDIFDKCLQHKENKLFSSESRRWGKTRILNEIGYTYQALGYSIVLVTQFPKSNTHYANLYFDNVFLRERLIGNYDKTIVIVDEYDFNSQACYEILRYFQERNISYVGFVRF